MINHPNRSRRAKSMAVLVADEAVKMAPKPRAPRHNHDKDYPLFELAVEETFLARSDTQMFQTDLTPEALWHAYYSHLGGIRNRQIHNCNACRRFIQRYGGLAVIEDGGMQKAAMWDPAAVPTYYRPAVNMLSDMVKRAKVIGPFYSTDKKWGEPRTGEWTHLSVTPYRAMLHADRAVTADQKMASKVQDFINVKRALDEWTPEVLGEAIRFLKSDALYRGDKLMASAIWLRQLFDRPKGKYGDNVLWAAIANAPEGFCHPRGGMLGTLVDDLADGKSFGQIRDAFNAKMDGLRYQRPQAAPAAGNVAQAEKLVEKLGITRSLERRFARLDEVRKIWTPGKALEPSRVGVFSHLMDPPAR
jgi:hypothetical protein